MANKFQVRSGTDFSLFCYYNSK